MEQIPSRFAIRLLACGLVATTSLPQLAHAADLEIDYARYNADRNRLDIAGNGRNRRTVTITNAFDLSQVIGTDKVEDSSWRVRTRRADPIPCRILATQSDGTTVEADVRRAPDNCAPKQVAQPDIRINNVTVNEGDGKAIFEVTLSAIPSQDVSLDYATSDNSALAGLDYTAKTGTLEFPAGNSKITRTFQVLILDDNAAGEGEEKFRVDLSNASNANIADNRGVGTIVDNDSDANPPAPDVSINSTSQNSSELAGVDPNALGPVPEQPVLGNTSHRVLAINDLGMHCGDLDTRVSSILPPFQVLLAQVIARGEEPQLLEPGQVEVRYSAVSNPNDPILGDADAFRGVNADGSVYKTNFWEIASAAYAPFYPAGVLDAFYDPNDPDANKDVGLPVPNVEELYLGSGALVASQHAMPGVTNPYINNDAHVAEEFYRNKPFFMNFPFGYVAEDLNWFEAAGIPFAAFDDFGRENPYPLVRVQAVVNGNVVATTDTVLPISGEAKCQSCHAAEVDGGNGTATGALEDASIEVATSLEDPQLDGQVPLSASIEWASDINILRLHDIKHQTTLASAIDGDSGRALDPVVCQTCHYTPALDLAHVGPSNDNGRNQIGHKTMSNVMHGHHGSLSNEFPGLFPAIPPAQQEANGAISNQGERLAALEQNCYQCHPGKNTQCLRGAMFNGGMLCSDCHGNLQQVGSDFSNNVTPGNPGAFVLGGDFYDPHDSQPRVPWANEPGCGSCHTGDSNSNLANAADTKANTVDSNGNPDGIRLRQAFRTGDAKATPIVPANKRFAEPAVPASFDGTPNKGAGNPQLYRVSTGHGGVMCEGCHGATHAEWPNANPNANDNVTAQQLQGHTGTISECETCHVTSQLSSSTQEGPHGMHLVNDSRFWREAHKGMAERENRKPGGGTCGSCHGSDHRGTVLSRTPVERRFTVEGTTRVVPAGKAVGCDVCHSLNKSFDD